MMKADGRKHNNQPMMEEAKAGGGSSGNGDSNGSGNGSGGR
jgi:hypothetical protein